MAEHEHMTWCTGDHDDAGECRALIVIDPDPNYDLAVEMLGVPHDSSSITISRHIVGTEELAAVIGVLTSLAPAFAAGQADVDCEDDHDEADDEADDEDDEPLICDGCGGDFTTLSSAPDAGGPRWLCDACCLAEGLTPRTR